MESRNVQYLFWILLITIFSVLNIVLAGYIINWSRPASLLMFGFLIFFNFSFSLLISKRVLSFVIKPYQLPKLNRLLNKPKVAMLYTTMNDVVPECLSSTTQTYPSDVFVLDDSTDVDKKPIVEKIAEEEGYRILRRQNRRGFKAGAINNWISKYGDKYDYIVLLDSDSYIPSDWVESSLMYAEHPTNSKIAIFQGLVNIWNLDNRFIETLAPLHVLGQDIWEKRLANHLDTVFCYGHNVLIRVKPILELGGFVEGYVSEDFATAVKLSENGYKSRFIPIHTYEAMPENIRGFIKRQNKWTRGSMEFYSFSKSSQLSRTQKLILLQTPMGHFSYIFIVVTMFLTIFGYPSTSSHLFAFTSNLWASPILYVLSIPIFQYVIVTSIISGIILRLKLFRLGISTYTLFKYQLLSKAIGAIMLPYEVVTIVKYFTSRKLSFPVTPKGEKILSLKETLIISKATFLIMMFLIVGLVLVNPLGVIFNITWLSPFFISPFVIYFFSRIKQPKVDLTIHNPHTNPNGGTLTLTCRDSQSDIVNRFLNTRI
jgi:cellulose synthase/poly-beta-1,6-N-acetylglucosamine synthase-like glycosyltransferase